MEELSKNNQAILIAYKNGYRIKDGIIFNPQGKVLEGYAQKHGELYYKVFGITVSQDISHRRTRLIQVHRFVAFQRFGYQIFQKGVVVRHLDGNSLNNLDSNIAIGTHRDNILDIPSEIRKAISIKASAKIRKFSDEIVQEIRVKKNNGTSWRDLMIEYKISNPSTLYHILKNQYQTKI